MGVKVAGQPCFRPFQPTVPQTPSSSQTIASAISSPSPRRRTRGYVAPLPCRHVHYYDRSSPFLFSGIRRMVSFELPPPRSPPQMIVRASSATLDSFSDEEFSKKILELALQFQLSNDGADINGEEESGTVSDEADDPVTSRSDYLQSNWPDEVITANLERKANSMDVPVSLRMIKRKLQWDEGLREAGESAYCSVKKAFSSMVFIIRELHSFTLQMTGILLYENLQGILGRMHGEMHASFVWLFQQIFSHTPTLMFYVMILLANFTVYSVVSNNVIAAAVLLVGGSHSASTGSVSILDVKDSGQKPTGLDSSLIKRFKTSSSEGKTPSVGGTKGGGGKFRPVTTGTGGEGQFPPVDQYHGVLPDGSSSQLSSFGTSSKEEESASGREVMEEEVGLWNSIVEEASGMEVSLNHESLDQETKRNMVSPITAKIEADDYLEYFGTELCYKKSLWQDPKNPLLLANYAQFLYLVSNDYDRAEEYFKMAIGVEPPDAEAYNKYASFLWKARGDLLAAEETYLGAISADPTNSFYAANYAHFLWNTGGEDTCFPLDP